MLTQREKYFRCQTDKCKKIGIPDFPTNDEVEKNRKNRHIDLYCGHS